MFEMCFILIIFVIGGIAVLLKIAFWIWSAWTIGRATYTAYNVFNAQAEEALRQLAMAMQAQNFQQARMLENAARRQVASLPRSEKVVYQNKLSDVVSRKQVLNVETGEWEEG